MEGFIVELPHEIMFDRSVDAIAQRYSMSPLEVLELPQNWFFNALMFINAENEVSRRNSKKIKNKSRRK